MAKYNVYRVGSDKPVRARRVGATPAGRAYLRPLPVGGRRAWLPWASVAAGVVAAVALGWLLGREAIANSVAAVDLARLSGRVPGWTMVGVPIAAAAVLTAVTGYLAFGHRLLVKLAGLAVVVVALAAPGLALGWANGTVSTVGNRSTEVQAVVTQTEKQLRPELPGKAMNVLLIGSDKTDIPDDPGRSDTQILVRLDPLTKSISMLSVPRDLRAYIPGVGYDKINTSYSYGGPAGSVKTFSRLTGLPIHHFVEVDFGGFWHVVNILGGIYLPVDHRYFVPASADFKSINLQPGYQLVHGKQALNLVRFRHDQRGDFTRMQRQQLFLKEMQRQSYRWSEDWTRVIRLIKAVTKETTSDIDSLRRLKPLVELIFQIDTSKVYTVHLEGATPMIDGISFVVPSQGEVDAAVRDFTHPVQAPAHIQGVKLRKKMYPVTVYNGSGVPGLATAATSQLVTLGYRAESGPDAPEFPAKVTTIYAPKSLGVPAQLLGQMFWPADVELVDRVPGMADGISVFVASSFKGQLDVHQPEQQTHQTLIKNQRYAASSWRALDKKSPLRLEMPTAWSPGFAYDQFRSYGIRKTDGRRVAAAVAVVRTPTGGYWDVQAMRWLDPPAVRNPNGTQAIRGTTYMLFLQGDHIHMVAWQRNRTLFWVLNTLDNELSNDFMMGLATSFKPVK